MNEAAEVQLQVRALPEPQRDPCRILAAPTRTSQVPDDLELVRARHATSHTRSCAVLQPRATGLKPSATGLQPHAANSLVPH